MKTYSLRIFVAFILLIRPSWRVNKCDLKNMKLPCCDVVIWHKSPSSFPDLFARIVSKSKKEPDESSEYQGYRDIHWFFSSHADAILFAEGLLEFAALEDVVKLTIIGASDTSIGRKVYKDTLAEKKKLPRSER